MIKYVNGMQMLTGTVHISKYSHTPSGIQLIPICGSSKRIRYYLEKTSADITCKKCLSKVVK